MEKTNKYSPKIIYKQIIIDDDYIRKNYINNKLHLKHGQASENTIYILQYTIDKNLTLFNDKQKQNLNKIISTFYSEQNNVIAHESQHIHNHAIGYNYIANSDNIYECMMLCLADEMSAMLAGYLNKTKNVDMALKKTINNLSGDVRSKYISGQFNNHFKQLQAIHGQNKNLYEHKFDSKKVRKLVDYYFTIDGQKVMNTMSKESLFLFEKFMTDIKTDIKKFINTQIINTQANSQVKY